MVGEIIAFAGSTTPENYLLCDGSAVSRTDYSSLFEAIGTTYGAGDGSTTFNVPDLTGKICLGISGGHALGTSGGAEGITLDSNNIPEHLHGVPQHGHLSSITAKTPSLSHNVSSQCNFNYTQLNGTRGERTGSNLQIYNSKTSAGMSRSTDFAVAKHEATSCTVTGGVSDCAAFDTLSAGSGAAHNNMMPYLALTYLIRYAPDVPPGPKMAYYNGALPVGPLGGYISGITR